MQVVLALVVLSVGVASAQFFVPLGVQQAQFLPAQPVEQKRALAHRAVVLNSEAEARLPPQFQNPFYKDPRIAAGLAKESWFAPGEQQVLEREAEKIPRSKILSILKHAGLARR
ncbi:uncharacterized protein [Anabrus simplex]|uniref:uncharacterized protein n=1 Tax=Anabrus simplex TaxID=316456 RepID=UPI0034DD37C2